MKRLLGLLLVMGMVGCGGGAKVDEPPAQAVETDLIAALEKLGAKIERNDNGDVVTVRCSWNETLTDAGLVHLKGMTNLQTLDLQRTKVTDAGLVKALARAGALLAPCRHISQRACF